ncbi:MAG TPA: alanine dehydrogenase, partial [Actinomycetota bacterium]|nr:alanine dehydrogenase [Actinomycetota bacterium]
YAAQIASAGLEEAVKADPPLAKGINVYRGELTYQPVAEAHDLDWHPLTKVVPALASGGSAA